MSTDSTRVQHLAAAQDEAIKIVKHLDGVNLRRCPKELRESVKEARAAAESLSSTLHAAILLDAKTRG